MAKFVLYSMYLHSCLGYSINIIGSSSGLVERFSIIPLHLDSNSVLDRHHIDADPDPTFHFDPDPDPDPDLIQSFTHVGKSEKFDSLKKKVV
jgi:hypothetical protein